MNRTESKLGLFSRIKQSVVGTQYSGLLVVVCVVGVYGFVRILMPQSETAQVRFVETRGPESEKVSSLTGPQSKDPFSGPQYDNAVRLRETSALGMAISLSVLSLNAQNGRLPENVDRIIRRLNEAKLQPPGIQTSSATIASDRSTFHVAYRREPFSFEVLAVPKSDLGSQLLFRFPLPQSEPNTVLYFETLRDKPAPAALSTVEQLSASGWKIRHWRGDVLSLTSATYDSLREQSDYFRNAR
ncbi:MAG TPA: hypothetical protein PKC65_02010 [Pyrinomonadaceae bacterium]|nr:hypothetical protein [Pyrinomonadaceae bacterium]